jgi:hypothetical protein
MTNYKLEQRKLYMKCIEMRVLQLLYQYQCSGDCIEWTVFTISDHLRISTLEVGDGLTSLKKAGYVDLSRGQWFITAEGRAAFEDECHNVSFQTGKSELQFRNEVLTGAKEKNGRFVPTDMTSPALPIGNGSHRTTNRVEIATVKVCSGVERIRSVARYYEVTPAVASDWCSTGEVHRCNRCGKYRRFHKKNGSNGQVWQSSCIECRKRLRS